MALRHFVKPFKTDYTNPPKVDPTDLAKRNQEYKTIRESVILEDYFEDNREKNYNDEKKRDFRRRVSLIPIVKQRINNESFKLFPEIIFREYFTKLVTESLVWDKEDVDSHINGIRYMCHSYIKSIGGMNCLKEASKNSDYLKKVYKVCLETGRKLAEKKRVSLDKEISPENVETQHIDFSTDAEDESMINKNISSLDVEQISDLVKDKVLEVVKDEENSSEKDTNNIDSIKEEIKSNEEDELPRTINNGDADTTNEDTGSDMSTDTSGETTGGDATSSTADTGTSESATESAGRNTSLLKSLTIRCYKRAVKESSGIAIAAALKNPINSERRMIPTAALNVYDSFLSGENEDLKYIDFVRNTTRRALASTDNININFEEILDESFAEALGFYTVLECAKTIKLIQPTRDEIRVAIRYNLKN